jgi:GH18 family chitinase
MFFNSHTNLAERVNVLDIMWRTEVPSDKAVLGLAFYARDFSAVDLACMDPGFHLILLRAHSIEFA